MLKRDLTETRLKVSGLYERLRGEYGGEEQLLQVLAKRSSSPSAVSASGLPSREKEEEEESQGSDAPSGDCGSQESFPDAVSLIKDCLAMNNIL